MAASSSTSRYKKSTKRILKHEDREEKRKEKKQTVRPSPVVNKTELRASNANFELLRLMSSENKNMEGSCYVSAGSMSYGTSRIEDAKKIYMDYQYSWNVVMYKPTKRGENCFSRAGTTFPRETIGACLSETSQLIDFLDNSLLKPISIITPRIESEMKEIHLLPIMEEFKLDNPNFSEIQFYAYKYMFENILGLLMYLVGFKKIQESTGIEEILIIDYFFVWIDLDLDQ